MRWFKHISLSHDDESLSELMDKFGVEGYGVYWLIMEKISQNMDENSRSFVRLSLKVWSRFTRVSVNKLQKLVTFLENSGIFLIEIEDEYLTINCPGMLDLQDEWTRKKSKNNSAKLRINSGVTPDKLQHDKNRIDKNREEDIKTMSGKPDVGQLKNSEIKKQAVQVLDFLNQKTGKVYRPVETNLKLIMARLKSGASTQDCFSLIAKKTRDWKGDEKMFQYLRPATLFNATKFEQYIGELIPVGEEE